MKSSLIRKWQDSEPVAPQKIIGASCDFPGETGLHSDISGVEGFEEISEVSQVQLFTRRVSDILSINIAQRGIQEADAGMFMISEMKLHKSIRILMCVALNHEYIRDLFLREGLELLMKLLRHPNDDIVTASLTLLVEITNAEVLEDYHYMDEMTHSFKRCNTVPELADALKRLIQVSAEAVSLCLRSIANILDIDSELNCVSETSKLLSSIQSVIDIPGQDWLLNRSFAVEILITIFQVQTPDAFPKYIREGFLDSLLAALSSFRSKNPSESLEKELYCNLIDVICILCESKETRETVHKLDGIQLFIDLLIMTKHPVPVLRMICVSIRDSEYACRIFLDHGGLKIVGPLTSHPNQKVLELSCTVLQQLLKNSRGSYSDRVIGKLVEKSCEKLYHIVNAFARLAPHVCAKNDQGKEEDDYLKRCERGLSLVQQGALIVLRLFNAAIGSLQKRILDQFHSCEIDLQDFIQIVLEYTQLLHQEISEAEINEVRELLASFQTSALAT